MAQLEARDRRKLRDSAFAYVDSHGRRRLPIHDAAHVRNALARFNQVVFEDEAARDRARTKLLRAAQKHGVVPIGFVTGQLRASAHAPLPTGTVTFLMSDVVDSTGLLHQLEDRYARLITELRRLIRGTVRRAGGAEVDARADEYFAVFRQHGDAVQAALAIQAAVVGQSWPDGVRVSLRIGLHSGRPTLTDDGYVGLAVHTVRRICSLAEGGQVLLSRAVLHGIGPEPPAELRVTELGTHRLKGIPDPELLYAVARR